jgi:hypothetical protein
MRRRSQRPLVAVLALAAALAGCGGDRATANELPPLDVALLAGDWLYGDAQGDSLFMTLAVTDTTLSGTGWITNAALRAQFGEIAARVPINVTGWASPTRWRAQASLALDPSTTVGGLFGDRFAGTIDATVSSADRMLATFVVTLDDDEIYAERTQVPIIRD